MGLNLRPLREQAGISAYRAAEKLGVTHVAYYKWETGQAYPTADKLPAIASLFGCSIDNLYGQNPPDAIILPPEGGAYHGA